MDQKQNKLAESIKAYVLDNRLSCAQAHQIADEQKVSLQEIGKKAEELGIKITKCQLGCF